MKEEITTSMKFFTVKNPFQTDSEERREAKAKADTLTFLHSEAKRRHFMRASFELQWQLNTNFLYGNQHCDIILCLAAFGSPHCVVTQEGRSAAWTRPGSGGQFLTIMKFFLYIHIQTAQHEGFALIEQFDISQTF